jgi:hypothetical protein
MSWLVELMRAVLIFTGITPPKPQNERRVALAGLVLIGVSIVLFVWFVRYITAVVMSH